MVEELSQRLNADEMINLYSRADELLAKTQNSETLTRLRSCVRRTLQSGRALARESASPNFIYADERTAELLRAAHRISNMQSIVLITGETGTGKELLARMIHEWSGRIGQFVAINCATLTETLFESILFGHNEDGITDVVENGVGIVHQAAGGTLFLDEIAELSLANQSKLLRLIEYGEAHATNSSEPERLNVRVVTTTSCDLKERAAQKQFRGDLLYRINAFPLEIPPLRNRPEDISALAAHFVKEFTEHHNKRVRFMPQAIEAMRRLPLRGNVRELRSLVERTILTAADGAEITREAVEVIAARQMSKAALDNAWAGCSFEEEVLSYEASLIKLAFENAKGSVTRAARLLGVTHQRLCSMLQGRHRDLINVKKPAQRRHRSIIKAKR
jgi:DNA-binding NtrC family response regulator